MIMRFFQHDDMVGIEGNLTSAAPTERVSETVAEVIDGLDELSDQGF